MTSAKPGIFTKRNVPKVNTIDIFRCETDLLTSNLRQILTFEEGGMLINEKSYISKDKKVKRVLLRTIAEFITNSQNPCGK